jgi:hypothetical protein
MKPQSEPTLSRVLHDLADVPEPEHMADRALSGARGLRRRRVALTGLAALAAAGALAVPFLLRPDGVPGPESAPVGAPAPPDSLPLSAVGPCRFLPEKGAEQKRVEPADWPDFVRVAIDKLPQRTDYVMQSGYAVCDDPGDSPFVANAYAVINLGRVRESGHLTLNLQTPRQPDTITTCQALRDMVAAWPPPRTDELPTPPDSPAPPAPEILFCTDGTAAAPMVYGLRSSNGSVIVSARYADHRLVYIESLPAPPAEQPAIGTEDLRRVVAERALAELLPVA